MLKAVVAGAVALAMGSGFALAQQGRPAQPPAPAQSQPAPTPPQAAQPAQQGPAAQPPSSDPQAATDSRVAALKARLMLTPDQEKNWPAFEQAYRDFARLRAERWRDLRAARRSDNPIENIQAWADFAAGRVGAMKRVADAALPLYQSLDQRQQRRFLDEIYDTHPMLARFAERDDRADRPGPRWRDRDDDDWRGRGPHGPHHWSGRGDGHGYGYGACPHMGPRSDWRDRDDDWRRGDGPRMGPPSDWRDRDDGWRRGDGPRMGPRSDWRDRDDDWRRGDGPRMGPRSDWRDRDPDDDGRGYWRDRRDGRDGGRSGGSGRSDEERF